MREEKGRETGGEGGREPGREEGRGGAGREGVILEAVFKQDGPEDRISVEMDDDRST